MRDDLLEIVLDGTVHEVRIPPQELINRLKNHPLSMEIAGEPRELFVTATSMNPSKKRQKNMKL
jgi:hypothetical protein